MIANVLELGVCRYIQGGVHGGCQSSCTAALVTSWRDRIALKAIKRLQTPPNCAPDLVAAADWVCRSRCLPHHVLVSRQQTWTTAGAVNMYEVALRCRVYRCLENWQQRTESLGHCQGAAIQASQVLEARVCRLECIRHVIDCPLQSNAAIGSDLEASLLQNEPKLPVQKLGERIGFKAR